MTHPIAGVPPPLPARAPGAPAPTAGPGNAAIVGFRTETSAPVSDRLPSTAADRSNATPKRTARLKTERLP